MTTPIVTTVNPLHTKTWISAIGSILTTAVPLVLGLLQYIPAQYAWVGAVVTGVIGLLQTLGVYKGAYAPENTSIVPDNQIQTLPPEVPYTPTPDVAYAPQTSPPVGGYVNPYKQ